jgi:hypothetical protein
MTFIPSDGTMAIIVIRITVVMAALVAAIHVLLSDGRRGCAGRTRA